ncbi:hypothetical protein [uncultured Deefgea sp.]|uniref:hypothetical protein n=1 Tax=uncultured Deefgea sp. TaxID=1304914 RepID=UPI00259710D1|nr:hypothetical protein [uncultured Deefgea sp.]
MENIQVKSIEDLFQIKKIDFSNLSIGICDNINFTHRFPLMPEDYLNFAYSDLKEGSKKGLINSLSNAKRSIDCIIEVALKSFAIDPKKIPPNAVGFCNDVLPEWDKDISPVSLRLFCALGFAPSFLIREVRLLRNSIEHEYEIPSIHEVIKASEVAELLLNTFRAKEIFNCCIDISDTTHSNSEKSGQITGIRFENDRTKTKLEEKNIFCLSMRDSHNNDYQYNFSGTERLYFYFIRCMIVAEFDKEKLSETLIKALKLISPQVPSSTIKIAEIHN